MSPYLENDFASIYINHGILYFIYKPVGMVNLPMAKRMIKARLEIQKGLSFPIFCDIRSMQNADKAAREYFANEGMFLATAVGLLANHLATEAFLKFFLRINKPMVPIKICESESEALEFLKPYIL